MHCAGFGVRTAHYEHVLEHGLDVPVVEVITENFAGRGGRPRAVLERLRKDAALLLHGVSMSLGGTDPLNREHLLRIRRLIEDFDPLWVSDHLCWGTLGGHYGHDLWPLPYTEEAMRHTAERILVVQEALGRTILVENVSSYVEFSASSMPEWEFLSGVVERSDAGVLLDVNNVFVSAKNHGFSAEAYLDAIPPGRIRQIHLAGHARRDGFLLDDHGSCVIDEVWELYRRVIARVGPVPTIIERDQNLPPLAELVEECRKADAIAGASGESAS